jgi:hypothetical protein
MEGNEGRVIRTDRTRRQCEAQKVEQIVAKDNEAADSGSYI